LSLEDLSEWINFTSNLKLQYANMPLFFLTVASSMDIGWHCSGRGAENVNRTSKQHTCQFERELVGTKQVTPARKLRHI